MSFLRKFKYKSVIYKTMMIRALFTFLLMIARNAAGNRFLKIFPELKSSMISVMRIRFVLVEAIKTELEKSDLKSLILFLPGHRLSFTFVPNMLAEIAREFRMIEQQLQLLLFPPRLFQNLLLVRGYWLISLLRNLQITSRFIARKSNSQEWELKFLVHPCVIGP